MGLSERATIDRQYRGWLAGGSSSETFSSQVRCYISTVDKYPCGGQHGIVGISHFADMYGSYDKVEVLLCNHVVRVQGSTAAQSAVLVYRLQYGDAYDELTALNVNRWEKVDGSWRIAEFRWDVMIAPKHPHEGMYLEKDDLRYYPGIHLPVVSGELDNPWCNVTVESEEKPDEEQVCECVCKYAFGIDTLCFSLVDVAVSPRIIVNMAPWGAMDKREFMQTLKYNRQTNRYWAHPVQVESVEIEGDRAFVKAYRMAGHKQKIMAAPEGIEDVYADARYEFTLERAEAGWQIVRLDYLLGILPWERNDNAIEVGRVGQDAH